jgi:hypothetical protein
MGAAMGGVGRGHTLLAELVAESPLRLRHMGVDGRAGEAQSARGLEVGHPILTHHRVRGAAGA